MRAVCLDIPLPLSSYHTANMGGESHPRIALSSYPKLVERPVGQHIKKIYIDRLRQFVDDGQYRNNGLKGFVCHCSQFIQLRGCALTGTLIRERLTN